MTELGTEIYLVIGIVMTLGGLFVLWKCPELMIALLLSGQDFIQTAFAIFGIVISRRAFALTGSVMFGTVVLVLGFGRLLGLRTARRTGTRGHLWIILMVVILGVFTAVGLAYTGAPQWGMRMFLDFLTFGVAPFVLCFLFIRDLASAKRLIVWVIVLVSAYVFLVSGHSLVTQGKLIGHMRYEEMETFLGVEVRGSLILQQHLAVLFSVLIGWYAMTHRKWAMWAIVPAMALIALFTIMSASRTGLLTFGVYAVIAPVLLYKRRIIPTLAMSLFVVVLFIVLLVALPEEATERILGPLTGEKTAGGHSGQARLIMWGNCLEMIMTAPVMGYGTGGFAMYYARSDAPLFPHNMFLQTWAENGIFAFAALCVFWVLVFYYPYQIWKRHRRGEVVFGLVVWILLLLPTAFIHGMLGANFNHAQSKILLVAGITARIVMLVAQEKRQQVDGGMTGAKSLKTPQLEVNPRTGLLVPDSQLR